MTSFNFFNLPREVRDLIYAECFESLRMELNCYATDAESCSFRIIESVISDAAPQIEHRRASVLSASQQLRAEMLEYLSVKTVLHVNHCQLLLQPATALRSLIPSTVRQYLRKIDLEITELGPDLGSTQRFDPFRCFTEWLMEAFPRLRTVVIRDSAVFDHHTRLKDDEEVEKVHANALRSRIWEHRSVIEDLYQNYQSEGLGLDIYITCFVEEINWDLRDTCWVCSKMMIYVENCANTWQLCTLRKPPETEDGIRLKREDQTT